jgi:protein-disulfide isomerase
MAPAPFFDPASTDRPRTTVRLLAWSVFFLCVLGIGWFMYEFVHSFRVITQETMSRLPGNEQARSASLTPEQRTRLVPDQTPALGASDPELVIVEFLDYDCPFCRASVAPLRAMVEQYQDRVRLVVRDFPIPSLHPGAPTASLAARCAYEQNRFWAYHDKLFATQGERTDEDFFRFAEELGLDIDRFGVCYANREPERKIQRDITDGFSFGVSGTPTFFFNGMKVEGALDEKRLEQLIQGFIRPQ